MFSQRLPESCLTEFCTASTRLDRCGFARPEWAELKDGLRPPPLATVELGEWQQGWQHHASSPIEHHFRETVILAESDAAVQAHMRSHSGPGASDILHGTPTAPEFRVEPHLFRMLILDRLPLPLTEANCECGSRLDVFGRHHAACPRSGRLRIRAAGPERTLARVCREAGATVRPNAKLRDMNACVPANDERAIEVLATGLPLHHGAQLAVDITLRSALTACGCARPNAAHTSRHCSTQRQRTEVPRTSDKRACQLVVVAVETGGRWSDEAMEFIQSLAEVKSREAPPFLRGSAFHAWKRCWTRMLAVSCGRAFASSLVSPGSGKPVSENLQGKADF